jgi:hypothetical protein
LLSFASRGSVSRGWLESWPTRTGTALLVVCLSLGWCQEVRVLSVFEASNLPREIPEVDECGHAEISNSKEETHGTKFRQVRATMCVIPYILDAA